MNKTQTVVNVGLGARVGCVPTETANHFTSSISHWRATRALDSPMEKKDHMEKVPDALFSPTKIPKPSEEMNRSFANYEAYKKDLSPQASKTEYRQFLTEV